MCVLAFWQLLLALKLNYWRNSFDHWDLQQSEIHSAQFSLLKLWKEQSFFMLFFLQLPIELFSIVFSAWAANLNRHICSSNLAIKEHSHYISMWWHRCARYLDGNSLFNIYCWTANTISKEALCLPFLRKWINKQKCLPFSYHYSCTKQIAFHSITEKPGL